MALVTKPEPAFCSLYCVTASFKGHFSQNCPRSLFVFYLIWEKFQTSQFCLSSVNEKILIPLKSFLENILYLKYIFYILNLENAALLIVNLFPKNKNSNPKPFLNTIINNNNL